MTVTEDQMVLEGEVAAKPDLLTATHERTIGSFTATIFRNYIGGTS